MLQWIGKKLADKSFFIINRFAVRLRQSRLFTDKPKGNSDGR
jgi:hypothetical protein